MALFKNKGLEPHFSGVNLENFQSEKVDIFQLPDNITFYTVLSILKKVKEEVFKRDELIIDFSEIKKFDTALLLILLDFLRESKKNNKSISFLNMPDSIKVLIKLYRLEKLMV